MPSKHILNSWFYSKRKGLNECFDTYQYVFYFLFFVAVLITTATNNLVRRTTKYGMPQFLGAHMDKIPAAYKCEGCLLPSLVLKMMMAHTALGSRQATRDTTCPDCRCLSEFLPVLHTKPPGVSQQRRFLFSRGKWN
ncbi:hypothetical protein ACJX0J_011524 [Zea mays]